jgi:hypothetical protein
MGGGPGGVKEPFFGHRDDFSGGVSAAFSVAGGQGQGHVQVSR